ncbi:MAG: hypothetical protein QME07_02775 [bacterium]|nr:hypothetical protein [bacterium]
MNILECIGKDNRNRSGVLKGSLSDKRLWLGSQPACASTQTGMEVSVMRLVKSVHLYIYPKATGLPKFRQDFKRLDLRLQTLRKGVGIRE